MKTRLVSLIVDVIVELRALVTQTVIKLLDNADIDGIGWKIICEAWNKGIFLPGLRIPIKLMFSAKHSVFT